MQSKVFITIFFVSGFTLGMAQDISKLYKNVNPSVVTLFTESKALGNNNQRTTVEGLGSGVLISENEVLTAAHVVNDAERIKVSFLNGEEIPAKVFRSAPNADVALLKLSWVPKVSNVAKLGDSESVSIGDEIIIVGAPHGLEHSLSVGHISGKHSKKERTSGFLLPESFQTDASINEGNSGGPMFNLKGEVIGIASYIITQSGGFEGIGFAATSNSAKKAVIDENRRWTGINGYILDNSLSWILNVPNGGGMLVESVVVFSPAYYAGLKGGFEGISVSGNQLVLGGDIILSVNGLPLTQESFENLQQNNEQRAQLFDQKSLVLQVLRGGKVEQLQIDFKE
ncbi:trypsin-like peptidase domain-containing protein [Ulvibacterium sp.]|uniref:S1C family serine protease n=1 Tax=Ulvibacterium sp. TaxID=2665914 RepID=UPI0026069CE5|nr:trypsin-like peptidase domain-containing protein [Ulvibacterium sp.]